jgi:hypothetical protein
LTEGPFDEPSCWRCVRGAHLIRHDCVLAGTNPAASVDLITSDQPAITLDRASGHRFTPEQPIDHGRPCLARLVG